MTKPFKPDGYNSLSPYIMADDALSVVEFLRTAFGGEELRRFDQPDGRIAHVEVRVDDAIVMLSDGTEDYPAFPVWLHLYVSDVYDTYRRALAAGGASAHEPSQKDGDPDIRCGVVDPAGNTWWISTQSAQPMI